jgi:hypothetical protein
VPTQDGAHWKRKPTWKPSSTITGALANGITGRTSPPRYHSSIGTIRPRPGPAIMSAVVRLVPWRSVNASCAPSCNDGRRMTPPSQKS